MCGNKKILIKLKSCCVFLLKFILFSKLWLFFYWNFLFLIWVIYYYCWLLVELYVDVFCKLVVIFNILFMFGKCCGLFFLKLICVVVLVLIVLEIIFLFKLVLWILFIIVLWLFVMLLWWWDICWCDLFYMGILNCG